MAFGGPPRGRGGPPGRGGRGAPRGGGGRGGRGLCTIQPMRVWTKSGFSMRLVALSIGCGILCFMNAMGPASSCCDGALTLKNRDLRWSP